MNLAAKDITLSLCAALTGLLDTALRNPGLTPWAITCRPFRAPEAPCPGLQVRGGPMRVREKANVDIGSDSAPEVPPTFCRPGLCLKNRKQVEK